MAKPVRWEPKKPYSKPTLIVFGTVRDLTQKVRAKGNIGWGDNHWKKTHPRLIDTMNSRPNSSWPVTYN